MMILKNSREVLPSHTTRPGIFASGDVVNGARTVVEAVAHSKVVAESMHEYMQSLLKDFPSALHICCSPSLASSVTSSSAGSSLKYSTSNTA